MDYEKLAQMHEDVSKKTKGGDGSFLYSSKIGKEDDIRILEPLDNLNGIYFMQGEGHWIDGTFYYSGANLGRPCVVEEELKVAREKAKTDKTLKALLEAKQQGGGAKIKRELRYLIPILHLNCSFVNGNVTKMEVIDDKPKILVAKSTLLLAINKIVTSRQMQNGTKHGIADRELGRNITLSKEGEGLDTTYSAVVWTGDPVPMEDKYYENVPDVYQTVVDQTKSDTHLRSVIRNYLYGEAIIPDEEKAIDSKEEQKPAENSGRTTSAEKSTGSGRNSGGSGRGSSPSTENTERTGRNSGGSGSRSLLDDAAADLNEELG